MPTTRERDRLRQQQLETIGWRFHRIWSPDWFHDRPGEIERIKAAYREALDADAAPPVVHADPPGAMATDTGQDELETRPVRRLPMPRLYRYDSVTEVPGPVIDRARPCSREPSGYPPTLDAAPGVEPAAGHTRLNAGRRGPNYPAR